MFSWISWMNIEHLNISCADMMRSRNFVHGILGMVLCLTSSIIIKLLRFKVFV